MRQTILDFYEIKDILDHPSVSKYICDDGEVDSTSLLRWYLTDPNVFVLRPLKGSCYIFVPWNKYVYEGHIAIVKGSERDLVYDTSKAVISWMFNNTEAKKLIARVPTYNRAAVKLAQAFGSQEGLIKNSFYKYNKAHDQAIFGLTKEEFQCQC